MSEERLVCTVGCCNPEECCFTVASTIRQQNRYNHYGEWMDTLEDDEVDDLYNWRCAKCSNKAKWVSLEEFERLCNEYDNKNGSVEESTELQYNSPFEVS